MQVEKTEKEFLNLPSTEIAINVDYLLTDLYEKYNMVIKKVASYNYCVGFCLKNSPNDVQFWNSSALRPSSVFTDYRTRSQAISIRTRSQAISIGEAIYAYSLELEELKAEFLTCSALFSKSVISPFGLLNKDYDSESYSSYLDRTQIPQLKKLMALISSVHDHLNDLLH